VPSAIIFEGKLRFRRKVTVRYGKPISCDELEINGADRQSLKAAREKLSARISELLEVGIENNSCENTGFCFGLTVPFSLFTGLPVKEKKSAHSDRLLQPPGG
jgi:hypothetical protein